LIDVINDGLVQTHLYFVGNLLMSLYQSVHDVCCRQCLESVSLCVCSSRSVKNILSETTLQVTWIWFCHICYIRHPWSLSGVAATRRRW